MGGNTGGGGSGGGGGGGGTGLIINTLEACERIKEEYNFLQAQNQSLKLECEKIAQEKTEMQRHYVMVIVIHKMRIQKYVINYQKRMETHFRGDFKEE